MKSVTMLVDVNGNWCEVEISGFHNWSHLSYVSVDPVWLTDPSSKDKHVFGIRFLNGKLEALLYDEFYYAPRSVYVMPCRPADEVSSKILSELFEDKAFEGSRNSPTHSRVPLVWMW